jgi:hypothetical protein
MVALKTSSLLSPAARAGGSGSSPSGSVSRSVRSAHRRLSASLTGADVGAAAAAAAPPRCSISAVGPTASPAAVQKQKVNPIFRRFLYEPPECFRM